MENKAKIAALESQAKEVRKKLLKMIHSAKSGHPGGSLSAADIMTVLYFDELKIDPSNPKWDVVQLRIMYAIRSYYGAFLHIWMPLKY